ncbi:MAG: GAF domain-containing protein [Desulfobacula sp.]|nr:GAF domain-containing protein [Desulfobacula sp.]
MNFWISADVDGVKVDKTGLSGSKSKERDLARTIEVLFKISDAVTHTRDLNELYGEIHQSLDKILNVDNFYIALFHEERDSISFPYHVDEKDDLPEEIFHFSETMSLTGKVIQAHKLLIFYEQDLIAFSRKSNRKIIGAISKIWMGAPLIIKDRVFGAMVIQDYHSATVYQKQDLELLNSVSQHVALAIERKAAEKEIYERERLQGVLEMAGAICHELNQPLQAILGYAELLLMNPEPDKTHNNLKSIKSQATRLGKITKKLSNITRYKTVEYPGNTKIIDIWGAGKDTREKETL